MIYARILSPWGGYGQTTLFAHREMQDIEKWLVMRLGELPVLPQHYWKNRDFKATTFEPPPWSRARAVFCYDDASKPLILRFKHADRLEGAPAFGRWLARAGAELLSDCHLIVPVPLNRWKLLARRYNQAALLAHALGRESRVAVAADGLLRLRRTPPQGHFSRAERQRNVRGAFAPHPRLDVCGKNVLLVDDVLTLGRVLLSPA